MLSDSVSILANALADLTISRQAEERYAVLEKYPNFYNLEDIHGHIVAVEYANNSGKGALIKAVHHYNSMNTPISYNGYSWQWQESGIGSVRERTSMSSPTKQADRALYNSRAHPVAFSSAT